MAITLTYRLLSIHRVLTLNTYYSTYRVLCVYQRLADSMSYLMSQNRPLAALKTRGYRPRRNAATRRPLFNRLNILTVYILSGTVCSSTLSAVKTIAHFDSLFYAEVHSIWTASLRGRQRGRGGLADSRGPGSGCTSITHLILVPITVSWLLSKAQLYPMERNKEELRCINV